MGITLRAKEGLSHGYLFKRRFRTIHAGRRKTAMSFKFVTMREEGDGLFSRALERAHLARREETFPFESNISLDY